MDLRKWFSAPRQWRRRAASRELRLQHPPRTPDGTRIYVFGDLHGRADLLARVPPAIDRDRAANPAGSCVVIGLGDYVDRGEGSKAVLDLLTGRFVADAPLIALRGNHEELLLGFLEAPERHGKTWFGLGGLETLRSYGVDIPSAPLGKLQYLRDELGKRLPPQHLIFLQETQLSVVMGDYFFSHAGARPGRPLEDQRPEDLLWMRYGDSGREAGYEKFVVHGHTPVAEPQVRESRMNIDTGAYLTGRLTCLVLEGEDQRFVEL